MEPSEPMSNVTGVRDPDRQCSLDEGLAIAWLGYEHECAKQGRKPNRAMFAGWAKRVGA